MRKNIVRNIIIHVANDTNLQDLSDKVSEFHVDIIERKLNQSNLTSEEKIAVIDKIIDALKSNEVNGIIK